MENEMELHGQDLKEEILSCLAEKKYARISQLMKPVNPVDAATLVQSLPRQGTLLLFRLLPKEVAAEAFAYMDSDAQTVLVDGFSDKELREVLDQLYLDDTVEMLEEMPANVVKRVLRHVDSETRSMINQVLNYPKDSAGSIMTMEYVDLKRQMTVAQAFQRIRETGIDKETVYTCYVTDSRRKLEGIVTVKDLLFADTEKRMEEIMETNIKYVTTHTDQEEVAKRLSKYDFLAVPVVDQELRLVGIVTMDDAMDVMEEEATEDIQRMAAITPFDKPYLKLSVFEIWKKRIPWLLVLMISATFTSTIISAYEEALSAFVILTNFIPMLMNTGGNAGSQSSTTMIRGISLGELENRNLFGVFGKELAVAFFCALTLSAANLLKMLFLDRVMPMVAVVVSSTLFFVVIAANAVGAMLPVLAKKLGLDPAVMASPVITTLIDAFALMIYFNIAGVLLHI